MLFSFSLNKLIIGKIQKGNHLPISAFQRIKYKKSNIEQHMARNLMQSNIFMLPDNNSPFYENWPLPQRPLQGQQLPGIPTGRVYHFGPPPSVLEPLPPLLPHRVQLQHDFQDLDTSLDTPPGAVGGAVSAGVSRPGSAHSAPILDLSIDRHYEFDAARTPTDELTLHHAAVPGVPMLPRSWNRPYLGYNPRTRDRELGPVADLASKERVFSDSEIYSPCFPRGRPGPPIDVNARVQAMKAEFAEYRSQQLQEKQRRKSESTSGREEPKRDAFKESTTSSSTVPPTAKPRSPPVTSPPPLTTSLLTSQAARSTTSPEDLASAAERLESII